MKWDGGKGTVDSLQKNTKTVAHLEAKQAGREEKHQRETDGQTFHGWHNEGMR